MEAPQLSDKVEVVARPGWLEHVRWRDTTPKKVAVHTRMRGNSRVVHPLMLECADLCTEQIWERIFRRAGQGKLPHSFSLKEDRLSVKIRGKVTSVTVPREPCAAMTVFQEFVEKFDNIFSAAKNATPDHGASVTAITKNLAHRRRFRRNMIERFVQSNTLGVPGADPQDALVAYADMAFTLHTGFRMNFFKSKDIIMDERLHNIASVKGVQYSAKHRRFDIIKSKYSVGLGARKSKPAKPRETLEHILDQMKTDLENRFASKILAASPPPHWLAEDDRINLHFLTLSGTDL